MSMVNETSRSYYCFHPSIQEFLPYSDDQKITRGFVLVRLNSELSRDQLIKTVKRMGNYTALLAVKQCSEQTQSNYCTDYRQHPTCDQQPWRFCKQHLTPEEMQDCQKMIQELAPSILGVHCQARFGIERGELEFMREILTAVKQALPPINPNP